MQKIILAENCGFCDGVKNSLETARNAKEKTETIFCLHPLIHNTQIIRELGIPIVKEDDLKPGDTVIISAHGTAPSIIERLTDKKISVIDATCPFLKNVHEKVRQYSQQGYEVIILGDSKHAEIVGTAGWCVGRCQIVDDPDKIDWSNSNKFLLTAQSTYDYRLFDIQAKKISENATKFQKTLEILKTICYTTIRRQMEVEKISSQCNEILVIGDKTSANTQKLLQKAVENGAKAHLITSISDLESVRIENKTALGIISGASTPKELIVEVFYRMSEEKVIDSVAEEVKENANVTAEEAVTAPTEEKAEAAEPKKITMEEGLKKYGFGQKTYREGMRLKARVISADPTGISVAIENGGKNDSGFISKDEAELDGSYDPANYPVDTLLDVIIIPKDQGDKNNKSINLSKKAYDALKVDDEHVQRILAGEEFTLEHTQEIKGGLLGKIGTYTIFVPASQIRMGYVTKLSDYVNKPLRLRAIPAHEELDEEGNPKKPRNPKRIVASQRVILEEEKNARDEEFWSGIYVGAIVTGKVKRFKEFGAFVSLKYKDALVRKGDLTWSNRRDIKPEDILEKDKSYEFIVLSVDREKDEIGLGYKQLQKKPIEIAQEKYPVGTVISGKVSKIQKYGLFVELEPQLDGLVHISEIQHGYLENINDCGLKEGDIVNVKVLGYSIDTTGKGKDRITLSIKDTLPYEPVQVETDDKKDAKSKDKKSKKGGKEEIDEGPHSYVSGGATVSLGSIFGNLNIETEDKKDDDKND